MRIWHRLPALVPLLLAVVCATNAQAQPMPTSPSWAPPAYSAVPGYGPAVPGYGPAVPGLPTPVQSHPMISPFDHALEQHFTSDGLWFKRLLTTASAQNTYYFNVDYVRTKNRGLTGWVGNENAATWAMLETEDATGGAFPDSLVLNNFRPANANQIPRVNNNGIAMSGGVRSKFGWSWGWDVLWNAPSRSTYNAAAITLNQRFHAIDALMLEAAGGNGLITTGFSKSFNERRFAIDNILTVRPIASGLALNFPQLLGDAEDILDRVLLNLHAIPLLNNVPEDVGGVAQRFDIDFIMHHEIETMEAGTHVTWSPIYEDDDVIVSPLLGIRYVRVDEAFSFFGADSGLDYTPNVPDGIDDDNDFVVDNVAENGTATFTEGNPSLESYSVSVMDSYIQSNLLGPELGLQYVLGEDDSMKITGSTRIGALFNHETARLDGDNILDTLSSTANPDPNATNNILEDGFDTTRDDGPTQNAFSDGKNSSHISPVFRQSLTAEYPLFAHVPVLQDCWQLEGARIRAGWTYMWIGELADPQQSINYVSNPRQNLFPHLNVRRGSFFQNQFHVGINWTY